ncbi:hypothetical protein [Pseudonocardia sp. KRD291]|uniref:hypothetical protein n=1 Tax=Pseudonocardia sp. KRD291 TaxID=2792007 RepID=UPI001C4A148F|nr:hypothetical protein [Pseudonocardia sp. KRD291]MBW0105560.1 hypothetical protein [Pseudonocardia sp. KRD291]
MTGDGPATPHLPGGGPAARPRAGTLVVLGTGPGAPPARQEPGDLDPTTAADLLAGADAVFTGPGTGGADPESAVLFYAEAWRVEPLAPRDAARRLDVFFAGRPGATGVLVTAGDPARDVAVQAAVEGLCRMRPELLVHRPAGVRVVPPVRSPLAY